MIFYERIPVRLRLAVGHAIWMALLFTGMGISVFKLVETNLNDSVNAALISSARAIRKARFTGDSFQHAEKNMVLQEMLRNPAYLEQVAGNRVVRPLAQIINISGRVHSKTDNVSVTLPVTAKALSRAESGLSTIETFTLKDNAPLRQVTMPVMQVGHFTGDLIQVGASLRHTEDTLAGLVLILWVVLPFVLVVSILFGYALTTSALKPVKDISRAAEKISVDQLHLRLPVPLASDELRDLSIGFNKLLARLEDSVHRLRRFTADVSHELRTPLAVIRGEAEFALRRERPADAYCSSLQAVEKEACHMTAIVEDLLLLARAESRSVAVTWEFVAMEGFLTELVRTVQPIFQQHRVSLEVAESFPDAQFICAPGYLALALKNILLNAAKHSEPGSKVLFRVYKDTGDDMIAFSVQDYGEGIPEKDLGYIFDPFFRSDTARNRFSGGVGIGLSLAQALLKLHGGLISVQSRVNIGTVFTAKIKLREDIV